MENRCEIEILLENLKKRLKLCNDELAKLPEGQLHQVHRGSQLTFFQAFSSSRSCQRNGSFIRHRKHNWQMNWPDGLRLPTTNPLLSLRRKTNVHPRASWSAPWAK